MKIHSTLFLYISSGGEWDGQQVRITYSWIITADVKTYGNRDKEWREKILIIHVINTMYNYSGTIPFYVFHLQKYKFDHLTSITSASIVYKDTRPGTQGPAGPGFYLPLLTYLTLCSHTHSGPSTVLKYLLAS